MNADSVANSTSSNTATATLTTTTCSSNSPLQSALGMIRQALNVLMNNDEQQCSPSPPSMRTTDSRSYFGAASSASSASITTFGVDCSQRIIDNYRNIFKLYSSTNSVSTRPSNQTQVLQPPKKRARSCNTQFFVHIKPKETWTHDFFCLNDPDTSDVPRRHEKETLQSAGLGRK